MLFDRVNKHAYNTFCYQIRDTGGDWQGKFRSGDSSAGSQNRTAHRHQDHQVRGNGAVIVARMMTHHEL